MHSIGSSPTRRRRLRTRSCSAHTATREPESARTHRGTEAVECSPSACPLLSLCLRPKRSLTRRAPLPPVWLRRLAYTQYKSRVCLSQDDLDALNALYPTCAPDGPITAPVCFKSAHNIGWVRCRRRASKRPLCRLCSDANYVMPTT